MSVRATATQRGREQFLHTRAGLGHNINVFQEVNFTNVNVSELAANWCVGGVNKTNSSRGETTCCRTKCDER